MFRILISLVVAATAAAFVPTSSRASSTALRMSGEFSKSLPFLLKPKNTAGWIGDKEFDPLGFSDNYDMKWMREAELKHGRVAMLAVVGTLVQQYVHLPDARYEATNPVDAFFQVGWSPMLQIFLFCGWLESVTHGGKMGMFDMFTDSTREPGDLGGGTNRAGANQLKGKSPSQVADMKLKELENGRLAMVAIGGIIHHAIIAGTDSLGPFPNPALWQMAGMKEGLPMEHFLH